MSIESIEMARQIAGAAISRARRPLSGQDMADVSELIAELEADGVALKALDDGRLYYEGQDSCVGIRWLPILRQYKPAIMAYLRARQDDCE